MKARLADLGGTPLPGSPVQFGKLIAEETEKWGKVISRPTDAGSPDPNSVRVGFPSTR